MLIPVICGGSTDTSRCVAEKKYTEQQAKKLFPQVFVPVCNPDGTYSEVTKTERATTLQDGSVHASLRSSVSVSGTVPQLHRLLLVRHPQWSPHQRFSRGQQETSMSRSEKLSISCVCVCVCTALRGVLCYDQLDV